MSGSSKSFTKRFMNRLSEPFYEHPTRAFLLLAIVLFSLLVVGAFIFTGGVLPAALGLLSFLTPLMAPFLVSTALSISIPIFLGLSLAIVLGVYALDAFITKIIGSVFKQAVPKADPSSIPLVSRVVSTTILSELNIEEKARQEQEQAKAAADAKQEGEKQRELEAKLLLEKQQAEQKRIEEEKEQAAVAKEKEEKQLEQKQKEQEKQKIKEQEEKRQLEQKQVEEEAKKQKEEKAKQDAEKPKSEPEVLRDQADSGSLSGDSRDSVPSLTSSPAETPPPSPLTSLDSGSRSPSPSSELEVKVPEASEVAASPAEVGTQDQKSSVSVTVEPKFLQDAERHGDFVAQHSGEWAAVGYQLLQKLEQAELNDLYSKELDEKDAKPALPAWLALTKTENSKLAEALRKIHMQFLGDARLCTSEDEYVQQRQLYLTAVICLSWAVYFQAAQAGKDFVRGSYTIVDKDKRLYTCFRDYAAFATRNSKPETVFPFGRTDLLVSGETTSYYAYSRDPKRQLSSHYKQHSQQLGIDLRYQDEQQWASLVLPNQNAHILFGDIGQDTFLKFEPHPLGTMAEAGLHGVNHATDIVSGLARAVLPVSLAPAAEDHSGWMREKDKPESLVKIYNEYLADKKQTPVKDDKVPPVFEMYRQLEGSSEFKKQFEEEAERLGYAKYELPHLTGNECVIFLDQKPEAFSHQKIVAALGAKDLSDSGDIQMEDAPLLIQSEYFGEVTDDNKTEESLDLIKPPKHERYTPSFLMRVCRQKLLKADYKKVAVVKSAEAKTDHKIIMELYEHPTTKKRSALFWPVIDREVADEKNLPGQLPLKSAMAAYKREEELFAAAKQELKQLGENYCDELFIPVGEANYGKRHWVLLHARSAQEKSWQATLYDPKQVASWNPGTLFSYIYPTADIESALSALGVNHQFAVKYVGDQGVLDHIHCGPFVCEYFGMLVNGQSRFTPVSITDHVIRKHDKVLDEDKALVAHDRPLSVNLSAASLYLSANNLSAIREQCIQYYDSKGYSAKDFLPKKADGGIDFDPAKKMADTKKGLKGSKTNVEEWSKLKATEVIQRFYPKLEHDTAGKQIQNRDQFSIEVVGQFCKRIREQKEKDTQEQALLDAVDIFSALNEIESTAAKLTNLKAEPGASLTEPQQALVQRCKELAELLERTGVMQQSAVLTVTSTTVSSASSSSSIPF